MLSGNIGFYSLYAIVSLFYYLDILSKINIIYETNNMLNKIKIFILDELS